ncbi:MAG: hypothetical protein OXH15_07445 [Gammaproteobacteria bacterium]|nr:hypothetical protein [Gammaproteobacteria bacterium]
MAKGAAASCGYSVEAPDHVPYAVDVLDDIGLGELRVGVVVSGVTLVLHFNEQITKVWYGIGEGLHDGLLFTSIPDRPVL